MCTHVYAERRHILIAAYANSPQHSASVLFKNTFLSHLFPLCTHLGGRVGVHASAPMWRLEGECLGVKLWVLGLVASSSASRDISLTLLMASGFMFVYIKITLLVEQFSEADNRQLYSLSPLRYRSVIMQYLR